MKLFVYLKEIIFFMFLKCIFYLLKISWNYIKGYNGIPMLGASAVFLFKGTHLLLTEVNNQINARLELII